jgi:hypothetical protein
MQEKGLEAKTKFECDQKNPEAEIKRKHMKEEEEQDEAARNRKAVAESSTKLTDTLAAFIANQGNDDAGIDAKLNVFKIIYFNSWMQENKLLRLGLPQSLMINLGIYLGF